jgi:hypothetical protein
MIDCGNNNRSQPALELAVEHCLDLMWLSRGDNQGMRDLVTPLLIRLGRIQEAYDFEKWWLVGADSTYDYGDTNLPYLSFAGENMAEEVDKLDMHDFTSAKSSANLALVKLIMMHRVASFETLAIQPAQTATTTSSSSSSSGSSSHTLVRVQAMSSIGIVSLVRSFLGVPLSCARAGCGVLELQVRQLLTHSLSANPHLLSALLDPDQFAGMQPEYYSPGSPEEACIALKEALPAWQECEGGDGAALRFLHDFLRDERGGATAPIIVPSNSEGGRKRDEQVAQLDEMFGQSPTMLALKYFAAHKHDPQVAALTARVGLDTSNFLGKLQITGALFRAGQWTERNAKLLFGPEYGFVAGQAGAFAEALPPFF